MIIFPNSSEVLWLLTIVMTDLLPIPIFAVGDFNNVFKKVIDKFTSPQSSPVDYTE